MSLTHVIKRDDYAILQLTNGKANPISHAVITQLRNDFDRIKKDDSVRGLILTGNTPGYFSVGLDLKTIFFYNEQEISAFWDNWNALIMDMIQFPKPVIAAINGHSPAGGCVLAVTCDYRMMATGEKFIIGLNEVAVGIVVPEYIYQLYSFWIGKRKAYHNLMRGRLMKVEEAHDIGLVDEVHEMELLLPEAEKHMKRLLALPDNILQHTKMNLRAELIDRLQSLPEIDNNERIKAWFDPNSRMVMKTIVDQLSGK